jgi:hypothetical protein
LSARKRICQAFASNRVDARVWRSRNGRVTLLLQLLDNLGPDQAGSANNDDLHDLTPR